MRTTFGKLPIGSRFHTGKPQGAGDQKHVTSWEVLEKTSKSLAFVREAHGGFRRVGAGKSFSHASPVWTL